MMDTDAIYSAVCAYGAAKCGGYTFDAHDHIEAVKRLLTEADEEHKSVLAENERLVDEVQAARQEISEQARLNGMGAEREARLMAENAELKAKLTDKASLLRGCYAADHKQKQRIEELTAELERIKALPPVAWRLLDKDPAGGSDDRWVVYTQDDFKPGVNPTEHFNIEPLIALGSKT